ncbi:MAG: rhodanese-like domain-containing protein [Saprospiraceae bacterium]
MQCVFRNVYWCLLFFSLPLFSQPASKITGKVKNNEYDKTIASILSFNIPILSVQEARNHADAVYLDARELNEYTISHIPGATFIGCDQWSPSSVQSLAKDKTLIVYCSVGYRSEKIATKIKALGFTHIYNLYGSIFEWVNEGYPLESDQGKPTLKLHTYNKGWSKWITNTNIQKIW